MTILSKLLNQDWSVPYNCYEVGHIWTPHCSDAAVDLFIVCFFESLKIYTPLYFASQLIFSRKFTLDSFKESVKSILRSSSFLSLNAFNILLFFCFFRITTGRFYYRIHVFFPTFFASLLAILVERPSRRFQLAIYVANIASECMFRYHVDKGNIRSIPRGEVVIFSLSMATLLYLIKQGSFGSDPVSLALKFYLGTGESGRSKNSGRNASPSTKVPSIDQAMSQSSVTDSNFNLKNQEDDSMMKEKLFDISTVASVKWKEDGLLGTLLHLITKSRHPSCIHTEQSCFLYAANGFYKPFVYSWLAMSGLTIARKYNRIINDPSLLKEFIFSSKSVNFGLFLGSFSALFKSTSCLLRVYSNGNQNWHGFVAGLIAGPSMLMNPNTTITLYIFWKALESLYWKSISSGYISHSHWNANLLYSFAVAQIAFCVLLQPKYMRPSYMKFVDQITGHKFHLINRMPLNVLVPEAICGYEEYVPDLHENFMTNKFMESLFVWLI